nr:MAG TPA: hypothetical protein [Caudoviricetes sp.]
MSDKGRWTLAAEAVAAETKIALQTVFDNLNQGQQKKLLKSPEVRALFDRYAVGQSEGET